MAVVKLVTERTFAGWYAFDDETFDGPETPHGFGPTEEAAIQDFRERMEDE